MSKKRRERAKEQQQKKAQQRNLMYGATLIIGLLIIGGLYWVNANGGLGSETFQDIHGMSYTPEGELYVATHYGLRIYDGKWSNPDIPVNDYMGYSGTEDGFYSSGHPGAGSNLINPLGLVRSTDYGETVQTIDFSGQSDFHIMGASYSNTDVVYVYNAIPNPKMQVGMYYTLDGGATWQSVEASGIFAQPYGLAVHPTEENIVAVATGGGGAYLSTDYGENFQRISAAPATSVTFDPNDENILYFGYQSVSIYMLNDSEIQDISVPEMDSSEAILYIASDPNNERIAIATSQWDVYTWDGTQGSQWRILADKGSTS